MVTRAARRAVVLTAQAQLGLRGATACRSFGVHRSLLRYVPQRAPTPELTARVRALCEEKPRWGAPRLTWRLHRDGWLVNHKRIERMLRDEPLLVGQRRRGRKRGALVRVPVVAPTRPDQRWSMDFVRDTTADGRPFRIWTLVDDLTRECPLLVVDRSLPARRVAEALDTLLLLRGGPQAIVCDTGPEFVSLTLDQWATTHGVKLAFIQPGKPVENCFIESFNGKLRDECLSLYHFASLAEARARVEAWRQEYHTERPHQGLGRLTPAEMAARFTPEEGASSPESSDRCVAYYGGKVKPPSFSR